MKRVAFLITLLALLAMSMSAYAASGEIQVSYIDTTWAFGGSLYIADKISVNGAYQRIDTDRSLFDVALGYDVSQTDLAYVRATVGVVGDIRTGLTAQYYPSVGLAGRADLSDTIYALGSMTYVLDPGGSWTKYSVGVGIKLTEGISATVTARGRSGEALKIGASVGLAF